jgi:hypothetical protein
VNHLDTIKDHTSTGDGLEPEHWPYSPLDRPMILLDPIIEVGTLPDPDWL